MPHYQSANKNDTLKAVCRDKVADLDCEQREVDNSGTLGGINSGEYLAAVAFNGGVQRRNSIDQANEIHALRPAATSIGVSEAQLENTRHDGVIDIAALMHLIHLSSEIPWNPNFGCGRSQIRTGRNFQVPDLSGGKPFDIRVHTRDDKQAKVDPDSNAAVGSVVRIEHNRKVMLSRPREIPKSQSRADPNWVKTGKTTTNELINSAHIPAMLPPLLPLLTALTSRTSQLLAASPADARDRLRFFRTVGSVVTIASYVWATSGRKNQAS